MAVPARQQNTLPTPPSARVTRPTNVQLPADDNASRRERIQANQLHEQQNQARNEFARAQLPGLITTIANQGNREGQESGNSQTTPEQRAEMIDTLRKRYQSGDDDKDGKSGSKKRTGLKTLRQAQSDLRQLLHSDHEIGLFGLIMFVMIGSVSLFLDLLPFVTGNLSSILDWIFDAGFYFLLFITMIIMTGDVFRSIFGFRGIINLAQTVLEFIPVSDIVPWHTVATIILYLDVKYDIVKVVKNLRKSGPSLEGGKTSE